MPAREGGLRTGPWTVPCRRRLDHAEAPDRCDARPEPVARQYEHRERGRGELELPSANETRR